ncbi:MAG: GNAT family N-acetyltransferase [Alphaproteobacteria bacterium]|nr:GNAT family N-acetyltransferase [Alphaproteobacteria bacterium]
MNDAIIRTAELDDAVDVARIKIAGWRSAYVGIVPDDILEGMDDIRTAAMWSNAIERPRQGSGLLVAEMPVLKQARPQILGFVHFAPLRLDDAQRELRPGWGEITALYVDPGVQRIGIGRRLLGGAFARLGMLGMSAVRLWSLEHNRIGNAFYVRCGGQLAGRSETRMGNQMLTLLAYDWPAPATVADVRSS